MYIYKILLYNNSCYFKAIRLSVFYDRVGFVGRKGKKPHKVGRQERAQAYSRNLWEAQMLKASFVHYQTIFTC